MVPPQRLSMIQVPAIGTLRLLTSSDRPIYIPMWKVLLTSGYKESNPLPTRLERKYKSQLCPLQQGGQSADKNSSHLVNSMFTLKKTYYIHEKDLHFKR